MDKILDQVQRWLEQDLSAALATVIKTWGSSPRPAGAAMAVSEKNGIAGSVSGGCVEGAVIDAAARVIQTGRPARLHFGVADEEAWQVGLSCGGEIEVFVRPFRQEDLQHWREAGRRLRSFQRLLIVKAEESLLGKEWLLFEDGEAIPEAIPPDLKSTAAAAWQGGEAGLRSMQGGEPQEIFLDRHYPPPTLVLVGGVHIAIPLTSLAQTLGYEVIVVDPRRLFADQERFPEVTRLLAQWPQEAFQQIDLTEATAVVMLTHDPKIDDPALAAALDSPAFYIGALGSRKTHRKRVQRLEEAGFKPAELDRIHAPVGLDLGGSSPEEIALAVMAEIVKVWHQNE